MFQNLDDETWERLEETLIYADVGATTTAKIVERLETEASSGELSGGEQLTKRLTELLAEVARVGEGTIDLRPDPTVILMVGVNGTGKTTTIGKIAWHLQRELGQVGAARGGRHLPGRGRGAAGGVGGARRLRHRAGRPGLGSGRGGVRRHRGGPAPAVTTW